MVAASSWARLDVTRYCKDGLQVLMYQGVFSPEHAAKPRELQYDWFGASAVRTGLMGDDLDNRLGSRKIFGWSCAPS
jgi:hypothetical protein